MFEQRQAEPNVVGGGAPRGWEGRAQPQNRTRQHLNNYKTPAALQTDWPCETNSLPNSWQDVFKGLGSTSRNFTRQQPVTVSQLRKWLVGQGQDHSEQIPA